MVRLEQALIRLSGDLQALGLRWALVRETLELIERRGFHRGKDLQAELARSLMPEG